MSAIARIINWINEEGHPIWWRHTVRLLLEKGEVGASDLPLIYKIAKKEAGFLIDIDGYDSYLKPVSDVGFAQEERKVTLSSLGAIKNVASLSEKSNIEFPEKGMTIIYGDNGSGKSSYAKILKNACLTRGDKPKIIGNVFASGDGPSSAVIGYRVGDSNLSANWVYQGEDFSDLKSVRVFDSKSALHYVEKEGELGYRPAGLHILDELAAVCRLVRAEVDSKLKENQQEMVLPSLAKATGGFAFLEGLSAETDSEELNKFCIDEDGLSSLEKVKAEIVGLKTKTPDELKKAIRAKILLVKPVLDALEGLDKAIGAGATADVASLRADYEAAKAAALLAKNVALSGVDTLGIGSTAWGALWEAARDYCAEESVAKDFPPSAGGSCPLCLQGITKEAETRLKRFDDYVSDVTKKKEDAAGEKFRKKIKEISEYTLEGRLSADLLKQADDAIPGLESDFNALLESISARKKELLDLIEGRLEREQVSAFGLVPYLGVDNYIKGLESDLSGVSSDEGLAGLIKEKQAVEAELLAKKTIADNRQVIEAEIKRQKKVAAFKQIKNQTNPGSITRTSTSISAEYVTNSLKAYFEEELKSFGFHNYVVSADVRGSDAAQLMKLTIQNAGGASLASIASEGEQKCLAIAGLLAELRADKRQSAVVFDDPVSSLDHKWRQRVATRLLELSADVQVIVFTHDIMFLKFLLEIEGHVVTTIALDRTKKVTGILRDSLPWEALSTTRRVAYLKNLLREAKKTHEEGTDTEYGEKAFAIYGYLREAWERLVEERLLNKVVERFGRPIQTNRLKRLVDISEPDVNLVEAAMTKCSGIFKGHDTATGLYENIPQPDEIFSDIDALERFDRELIEKRKRG